MKLSSNKMNIPKYQYYCLDTGINCNTKHKNFCTKIIHFYCIYVEIPRYGNKYTTKINGLELCMACGHYSCLYGRYWETANIPGVVPVRHHCHQTSTLCPISMAEPYSPELSIDKHRSCIVTTAS